MASVAAGLLAHAGLLVILQPDHLDQAQLLLQPAGVVFLGIRLLGDEDLAGNVVAMLLAQGDALGEVGAYAVLQVQVLAQHLLHGLAGLYRIWAHVRVALEEQDPAQDRVRVLRFLLHLVVDALVQLVQAQVLVAARVQEILVARGQLAAQEEVQVIDDFGISLHGGTPWYGWTRTVCRHRRREGGMGMTVLRILDTAALSPPSAPRPPRWPGR